MMRALLLPGLGLLSVFAAGCSSQSDAPAGSGGVSTNAGAGGASNGVSGGGSAGKSSTGPVITTAPPAWVRPADCGGIGNLCPNLSGCAEKSSCQLEGNVCIPALIPGATSLPGLTAATPYCAAYTCMTFDEASCFCTGEAGKTVSGCKSPSALAGLCVAQSFSCADKPCCEGASCVDVGSGQKQCQVTCAGDADCPDTGCCTDPHETGVKICSPKAACDNPCKKHGEACMGSATVSANCCDGSCVISETPAFSGCRPQCTTNTQCATGCCKLYAGDNNGGFCVDASYCGCGSAGAACGPDSPSCCAGTSCAGNDSTGTTGFSCYPSCKVAADCTTQCCALFAGEDNGVCVAATECGL